MAWRKSVWVSGLVVAACGGKAIMDAPDGPGGGAGSGGATTSTSTTSTTTTTTTTTGDCTALEAALSDAIAVAQQCEPNAPMAQCDGSAFVYDMCSCQVLANEKHPGTIDAALAAYDAWVAAGCGPWLCEFCPAFGPGFCMPGSTGGGTCTAALGG